MTVIAAKSMNKKGYGTSSEKGNPSRTVAARRTKRSPATSRIPSKLSERARRLASSEIAYIGHPEFSRRSSQKWLDAQNPGPETPETQPRSSQTGRAFLPGLVQAPLLTPDRERYLFLKMNYLKFTAERLRRRIDVQRPDEELLDQIESLLTEATSIRNRIVESNVRLVIAVGTKLSRSLDQLGDLVSEGLMPLMRSVELFDVGLGNRFSTYATWAVRNQMHRALKRKRLTQDLSLTDEDSGWDRIPEKSGSATNLQEQEQQEAFLLRLAAGLSDREQQIIFARFGLRGQPSGRSLSEISSQVGLSKERVRQIVLKSIAKMRATALELRSELPECWNLEP